MCPLCKSRNIRKLFDLDKRVSEKFAISKCEDCGIAWTDPLPDDSEISQFYPEEYHGKKGKERFLPVIEMLIRRSRRKRAMEISRLNDGKPGKVLDIGCGRGWMLSILKSWRWDVCGTELSVESSSFARERLHLNIFTKQVSDCDFPSGRFDVVTLWHVLEHLNDPVSVLKEANRLLKENGVLVVEVPNFGCFQANMFGNKWFHLDAPRHLFHFNDGAIRRYLEDSGFEVTGGSNISWEYDPFGFVQSVLNGVSFKFDYLYNFLRTSDGRMIRGGLLKYSWDLILSVALAPVLLAISVPVSLFSGMMGSGGVIKYHCVKRSAI